MKTNTAVIDVLNDLIRINNDRITGYEKAAHESNDLDNDLRTIFYQMASESRAYVNALHAEVLKLGGEPVSGTTTSGKLYRVWMDMKATFTGSDTKAILDSCEYGEDAAQKAYRAALADDAELPASITDLIAYQQSALKKSHDLIKNYRNSYAEVK